MLKTYQIWSLIFCTTMLQAAAPCFCTKTKPKTAIVASVEALIEPPLAKLNSAEETIIKLKAILTAQTKTPLVELHKYLKPSDGVDYLFDAGHDVYVLYYSEKSNLRQNLNAIDARTITGQAHVFAIYFSEYYSPNVALFTTTISDHENIRTITRTLQENVETSLNLSPAPNKEDYVKVITSTAGEFAAKIRYPELTFSAFADHVEQSEENLEKMKALFEKASQVKDQDSSYKRYAPVPQESEIKHFAVYSSIDNTFIIDFFASSIENFTQAYAEHMQDIIKYISTNNLHNSNIFAFFASEEYQVCAKQFFVFNETDKEELKTAAKNAALEREFKISKVNPCSLEISHNLEPTCEQTATTE